MGHRALQLPQTMTRQAASTALIHSRSVTLLPIQSPEPEIFYHMYDCPFGQICIASDPKGICKLDFAETEAAGLAMLKKHFPSAKLIRTKTAAHGAALRIFGPAPEAINLHVQGTEFQLKVWNALLSIPKGGLSTYGEIAEKTGHTGASRAVGSAVGANPVGYIIPCHRVVRNDGSFGEFLWGREMKVTLLNWEAGFLNPKLL
jgi:AraC family transcriptional regulator of adaptative response/methylated-DNA-[protein]-cysteine methyltransferase